jgi:uncharacterized protein
MEGQFSYPDAYDEEIPSEVHTIIGVATSIAAFIGWARKGPIDKAQRVQSWMDFERSYGGLESESYLGYAVRDFFTNGGLDAYIIRLVRSCPLSSVNDKAKNIAKMASAEITGFFNVKAKNPGVWGNYYRIGVKPLSKEGKFQLRVSYCDKNVKIPTKLQKNATKEQEKEYYKSTNNYEKIFKAGLVETFENLSTEEEDKRYFRNIINDESDVITIESLIKDTPPVIKKEYLSLQGGNDGLVLKPGMPEFDDALKGLSKCKDEQQISVWRGYHLLDKVDLFNLLCIPGYTNSGVLRELQGYCRERRAFLIIDCDEIDTVEKVESKISNLIGDDSINSAFYFPWVNAPDLAKEGKPSAFPPSGFVAGIYSKIDANRGVFRAPAGVEASLAGALGAKELISDKENGVLNQKAINCIRSFPVYGTVIWGARTLPGSDELGSEWKYIPVRRMALFIEESLIRGLKWVVFEPNDEPLWFQIRLSVGTFMQDLFRKGAFEGQTPKDAYFVKCDRETTTQYDIDRGFVNIVVGFAPLKPAEFVVIKLQQMAGQLKLRMLPQTSL